MPWPHGYDPSGAYDEIFDPEMRPRPGCAEVVARLEALGSELFERQRAAEAAIRSMGVTFTLYSEGGNIDRSWPVDVIPRIIAVEEWTAISNGLIQRLTALNLFIDDLYNNRKVIKDGVFPGELLEDSANYRQACRDASPKGGVWAHISGSDLVRDSSGEMFVLEDNLRIPSGVSYMLENRQVSKRVFADLFRDLDILPVDGYTGRLSAEMKALSPREASNPSSWSSHRGSSTPRTTSTRCWRHAWEPTSSRAPISWWTMTSSTCAR